MTEFGPTEGGGWVLVDQRAQAYVHRGMWIADCTRPYCGNAMRLDPKQTLFHCSECKNIVEIVWPADADAITDVLARRPVPQTRNWAPAGHRQAVACGFTDGQTVADLAAENREHGVS